MLCSVLTNHETNLLLLIQNTKYKMNKIKIKNAHCSPIMIPICNISYSCFKRLNF